jgi:lysophospholipase L1-like esterase
MPLLRPNDRVLFQGDSITNAFRKPEEISTSYALGAGWAMIVAAIIQGSRPADGIEFINRGVSGDGVARLQARWQADCLDLRPDVLSVLVGVNETLTALRPDNPTRRDVEEYRAGYRQLLSQAMEQNPKLRMVIAEPFALEVGIITPAHRAHLRERAVVAREIAAEFGAVFVPLQEPFDRAAERAPANHWLFDGIHPHAAGQWLIARQWLRCVEQIEWPDA